MSALALDHGGWTDERVELLKTLWNKGHSAARICNELGFMRNAVIGKVHRLGLSGRIRSNAAAPRPRRARPERPSISRVELARAQRQAAADGRPVPVSRPPMPKLAPAEMPFGVVSFFELRPHHCRFPRGDSSSLDTIEFCAGTHGENCPYCPQHRAIAWMGFLSTSQPKENRHGSNEEEN